jgi:hypothetical protein
MKLILSIVLLLNICFCFAQDKNDFSIEFNVNGAHYDMQSANYIFNGDYFVVMDSPQNEGTIQSLDYGLDYNFGFSYQPFKVIDFGAYASFQNSTLKRSFLYEDYNMNLLKGDTRAAIKAFSFGLSSNLYLNKLFHFDEMTNSFFNKMRISLGVKGGIGFSSFEEQVAIQDFNIDYRNVHYNATNFNGRTEVAIGYPIVNSSLFSNIGFKFGCQFFKTSTLKNFAGLALSATNDVNSEMNLDFSGLFYGIYLNIGKH